MEKTVGGKYPLQTMADTVFELLCLQISSDYTSIIRNFVLPEVSNDGEVGVREVRVLLLIDSLEGIVSSAQIAEGLRFDPGTVTRASKRLVEAGFLNRKKMGNDRRTLYFDLTRTGRNVVNKYRAHLQQQYSSLESEASEDMSIEERKAILIALAKLRNRSEALARANQSARELVSSRS